MAEEERGFCNFQCVSQTKCGRDPFRPKAMIPALGEVGRDSFCRSCSIPACRLCQLGADEECVHCMPGYFRSTDKTECVMLGMGDVNVFFVVAAVVVIAVVFILFDLWARPIVNQAAVDHCAEIYDTACFLRSDGTHWPWWTNIMSQVEIGGPGSLLHFRFQMAVLVWAIVLYVSWMVYAGQTYPTAIGMGLRTDPTTRVQFCQVSARGPIEYKEALPTMINFGAFAYLFSFIGCIIYAAMNQNLIHRCDNNRESIQDFVANLLIPVMSGRDVERKIKDAVERATGQSVVGVCVAWNYVEEAELIPHLVPEDGDYPEKHRKGEDIERTDFLGSTVDGVGEVILEAFGGREEAMPEAEKPSESEVVQLLEEMKSSNWAIIVFDTEHGRDEAIAAGDKSVEIDGNFYSLMEDENKNEPESIIWEAVGTDIEEVRANERAAYLYIIGLVFGWVTLFYVPYVSYEVSFTYRNGDEPGAMGDLAFTVIVVGTQVGLFTASAMLAEGCGFCTEGQVQLCYVHLYLCALFVNLVIDMCLTAAQGYFYAAGQPGADVTFATLTDPAEVLYQYVLQKFIGIKLYQYAYPATFLIPFLMEPAIVVLIPWYLISILVRAKKSVSLYSAEKALCIQPYDQGRYADIMFNVMCVAFGFGLTPGLIDHLTSGLIISGLWIYFMDHFRVLYYAKPFNYSSPCTHQRVLVIWSLPCCVLLCCLIIRVNASYLGTDRFLTMSQLSGACIFACLCHHCLHTLIIQKIIPLIITPPESEMAEVHYADVAKHFKGQTYFDLNPVHVLREIHLRPTCNNPRPSVLSQPASLEALQSHFREEDPLSAHKTPAPIAEEDPAEVEDEEKKVEAATGKDAHEPDADDLETR
eukprot:TRINITY_DN242_c2_g1_i1.p1 TRINITY_DN242_c2_g1~~TRINITY_DN242_c2_g1_i1.p1  ORF type:complete len:939 (+),score=81.86 TRINITY_DN242_c2_g1_i1:222-2819(+)